MMLVLVQGLPDKWPAKKEHSRHRQSHSDASGNSEKSGNVLTMKQTRKKHLQRVQL
jgi:hypothetical protein